MHRLDRKALLLCILCGASNGFALSCSSDGPTDVTGSAAIVYLSQAGEWSEPTDPDDDVWVRTNFDSELESDPNDIVGRRYADGRFEVRDVDADEFLLHVGGYRVYLERQRTQDLGLGYAELGRPNTTWLGDSTGFDFSVDGLRPFALGDTLAVYVPSVGAGFLVPDTVLGYPSEGDESINATVRYGNVEGLVPLLDSPAGDDLYLVQTTTHQLDGHLAESAVAALQRTVSTQAQQTTRVDGALAAGSAIVVSVDFEPSMLAAIEESQPFGAALVSLSFGVQALPQATKHGWYQDTLSWWSVSLDGATAASILDSFHSPFPSDWLVSACMATYSVRVVAAGGSEIDIAARTRSSGPTTAMTATPALGPIRNLRIADQSARGHLSGVSRSPVLEWDVPVAGTPSSYSITLLELVDAKNGTPAFAKPIMRLFAFGERARMPVGFLHEGRHYVLRICSTNERSDFSCMVSSTFSL